MSTDTGRHADRGDDAPRPAGAFACAALGCRETSGLRLVVRDDGAKRVLCRFHEKHFLEVSS